MSYNSRNRSASSFGKMSDDASSEDHWLNEVKDSLEKAAVQSRERDQSVFEQITSIMNGTKSKHTSVAAAVEEMKERSGLKAYLERINKVSEEENEGKIVAAKKAKAQAPAAPTSNLPQILTDYPEIKSTLENYVSDTKGNISVPGILHRIRSIHEFDVANASLWDDEKLIRFISNLNLKAKSENPYLEKVENNLGYSDRGNEFVDPENYDAFYGLESKIT